jgi:hypothetical protein
MEISQEQFDALIHYTIRVALQNGKVLIYPVDAVNKHYLSNKLYRYSHGSEDNAPFPFLWFETVKNRNVLIANDCIARITFCSDLREFSQKEVRYYDNFNLLGKEPVIEEFETGEGESKIIVFGDEPPQALIYHKGQAPDDGYSNNPLTFNDLEEGCLGPFFIELEGDCPLRRFVCLTDEDGEETFVSTSQIIVMEFDQGLQYEAEDPDSETFDGEEETEEDTGNDEEQNSNRQNDLPF